MNDMMDFDDDNNEDDCRPVRKRIKRVRGTLSIDRFKQDINEDYLGNLMLSAMANPDLLSDEGQSMFPERDFDQEELARENKLALLAAFRSAFDELTDRQKQVLTMLQSKKQEEAAKLLNISRNTLAVTLMQVKKKMLKHINKRRKTRLEVEDI